MEKLLSPNRLATLANSTPLGSVITEKQMMVHRTLAGVRAGDGKKLSPIHYLAWIIRQAYPKNQIARASSAQPVNPERLPQTREELDRWMHDRLASPKAIALRLLAVEDAVSTERGIARLKALEMLDSLARDVMPDDGREEHILLKIYDESTKGFEEEGQE